MMREFKLIVGGPPLGDKWSGIALVYPELLRKVRSGVGVISTESFPKNEVEVRVYEDFESTDESIIRLTRDVMRKLKLEIGDKVTLKLPES